jgi:hypothetical protein
MNELEQMKQREEDYLSEFKKATKNLFSKIASDYAEISQIPIKSQGQSDYMKGYLTVLNGAYSSIKTFLDDDNLRKDYPAMFKNMRDEYRQTYLTLRKADNTHDGQYQAAVKLYKDLDSIIQTTAGHDLNNLQNHQLQMASHRR